MVGIGLGQSLARADHTGSSAHRLRCPQCRPNIPIWTYQIYANKVPGMDSHRATTRATARALDSLWDAAKAASAPLHCTDWPWIGWGCKLHHWMGCCERLIKENAGGCLTFCAVVHLEVRGKTEFLAAARTECLIQHCSWS